MGSTPRTKALTPIAHQQGGGRDLRFLCVETLTELGARLARDGVAPDRILDEWDASIIDALAEARDLLGRAVATNHVERGYWRWHNLGF